jgi:hypothetical protein
MLHDHPAIRFYVRSVAAGFAVAAAFVAALLWADVAGLRHLVTAVDGGYLGAFLIWFFSGIVFTGAQASVSLLLQAEEGRGPGGAEPLRAALEKIRP